ncbi:MAG: peroxiredoxin [Bacteroidota bacterium]
MKYAVLTTLFLSLFALSAPAQEKHLDKGDTIPSFSLQDQDGKLFNSVDYVGRKILVIYFYPKDESSVCTKEACSFRDSYTDFTNAGAMVIGINHASVETHKKFQVHHNLPFTLLSDPENKVLKMFGVKNKFMITGRETFVIDKSGKIVFRYDSFTKGKEHQEEALRVIGELNASERSQ